mmetsp:Transcript_119813/g.382467  ORF Transcript_119813/g.382467 Transcript_119813/m.382467 type:complete len:601 (-) Transcript_119813:126-1928(-)|eukprot:CAMPEP_0203916672 /NCGR_PEP_ID=MMETSP0359-20131031/57336_1 /ASSEMBLY_ACC=CAM_ASM_000338 /TAXON_ID=268821 /ORGANISM="Scrippsiella Hangoei, Strain SHTV-5" /LENGTH=600 /DNA_ID=CAMNT_0050843413 /DNA_START=79 /DNA_END=1881 /DNA_ORIENTATION=-
MTRYMPSLAPTQARRSCRVEVSFPELPSDVDTETPSWRTGLHSDWLLRVGPAEYRIHKVLTGHGPRASAFLCSAFTTGQQLSVGSAEDGCSPGACRAETDLSNILPEQVWPFVGQVLDFIYSQHITITIENAVPLLRCADALQIRSLFLVSGEGINELLSVTSAPKFLGDTVALLGGELAEQIQTSAQNVIADSFDSYSLEDLRQIPTSQLVLILKRDDLSIVHENEVFDRVRALAEAMQREDSTEDVTQLWQTVRLGALSNGYFVKAAQVDAIPKMALIRSKVLHRRCGNNMLQGPMELQAMVDNWPVGPCRPRKPFKDLVCAVLYSVDTEARSDPDVERNITAATLVVEEIEFLGGRAQIENIFAGSPSARENAEPINMDKVDVAFVLAPWTPSDKRIASLINFVDNGGGAVLLSFIGGLSKGTWLEHQYEPLLTGKVGDNTPYEDVFLATAGSSPCSLDCSDSSIKRTQDTVTPPRILCGVDSINGRRRITSKLVDGAKVLAKWSDGQPLVVQHPSKNVFSVSQRVSRIFELDDDLGHDDTLQLVLNVMVYAGKESKRLQGQAGRHTVIDSITGLRPEEDQEIGAFITNAGGVNVSL